MWTSWCINFIFKRWTLTKGRNENILVGSRWAKMRITAVQAAAWLSELVIGSSSGGVELRHNDLICSWSVIIKCRMCRTDGKSFLGYSWHGPPPKLFPVFFSFCYVFVWNYVMIKCFLCSVSVSSVLYYRPPFSPCYRFLTHKADTKNTLYNVKTPFNVLWLCHS